MRTLLVADAIADSDALWVATELTTEDEHAEVMLLPSEWIGDHDPVTAIEEVLIFFDAQRILVATYSAADSELLTRALVRLPVPAGQVAVAPPSEALQAA
jgi:hypothetical protein